MEDYTDSDSFTSCNSDLSDSISGSEPSISFPEPGESDSSQDSSLSDCNEDLEPVATEAEQSQYQREVEEEEEEQVMLQNRFEGNIELRTWYVTKACCSFIL